MKKAGNRQFSMAESAQPLAASSQPLAASLAASDDKLGSLKENQSSILAVCRLPGIDDSKTRGFQGRMILRLDGVRLVDW